MRSPWMTTSRPPTTEMKEPNNDEQQLKSPRGSPSDSLGDPHAPSSHCLAIVHGPWSFSLVAD